MKKRKILVSGLIICAVILIALLITIRFLGPGFINSENIKVKIQAAISQKTGGKVEYQRLGLSIFPRPGMVISRGNISIPKAFAGTFDSLSMYPKILPLFKGKLHIAEVQVESPDFGVDLIESPDKIRDNKRPLTVDYILSLLDALGTNSPYMVVELKNGRLDITVKEDSKVNFNLRKLSIAFYMDKDRTEVALTALDLEYPQLTLSGKLIMDEISEQISLELKGREVDVKSTRDTALVLAGDNSKVKDIFKIMKGGTLPFITFTSQGSTFDDLDNAENSI